MSLTINQRNKAVTQLLNGTYVSMQTVIPLAFKMSKPQLLNDYLILKFGVLIGITGDIKGKLVLSGQLPTFATIGETMFGMAIEGDMLESFSGELGNMLAGNLSTNIVEKGFNIDITHPSIIQGNTRISGYEKALKLTAHYDDIGDMDIFLLID